MFIKQTKYSIKRKRVYMKYNLSFARFQFYFMRRDVKWCLNFVEV